MKQECHSGSLFYVTSVNFNVYNFVLINKQTLNTKPFYYIENNGGPVNRTSKIAVSRYSMGGNSLPK
jgi:hypothetical protein